MMMMMSVNLLMSMVNVNVNYPHQDVNYPWKFDVLMSINLLTDVRYLMFMNKERNDNLT